MNSRHHLIGHTSKGFTLVEVLVSIIIFSVGLIGIAKLQVVSKQSSYDAVQRVTATSLAQDLLERMRANNQQLLTYVTVNGVNTVGRGSIVNEPTPVCNAANTCTAGELASHDLWEFEQALDGVTEQNADGDSLGGLSIPTACITGPTTGDSGVYTIAIAWRGKTGLSNPTTSTCGATTDYLYGTNHEYRRLLVIQTFIST